MLGVYVQVSERQCGIRRNVIWKTRLTGQTSSLRLNQVKSLLWETSENVKEEIRPMAYIYVINLMRVDYEL